MLRVGARLQLFEPSLSCVTALALAIGDTAADRPSDACLEVDSDVRFLSLDRHVGAQGGDGLGGLLGSGFPYPQASVVPNPPGLEAHATAKERLQNVEWGRVQLRDGDLQIVSAAGLAVLDDDASLAVYETGGVSEPHVATEMRWQREVWALAVSGLLREQIESAIPLQTLVMERAESVAICRSTAITNRTEAFGAGHELTISAADSERHFG